MTNDEKVDGVVVEIVAPVIPLVDEEAEIIRSCKDCGATFKLSAAVRRWYKAQNFELPRRCVWCRALRRARDQNSKLW